jgi:hypothetical protein
VSEKEKESGRYKEQDGERARNEPGELVDPANALDCSSVERRMGKSDGSSISTVQTNLIVAVESTDVDVSSLSLHVHMIFFPLHRRVLHQRTPQANIPHSTLLCLRNQGDATRENSKYAQTSFTNYPGIIQKKSYDDS